MAKAIHPSGSGRANRSQPMAVASTLEPEALAARQDAEGVMAAFLATGASIGEALGLASQVHGPAVCLPLLVQALNRPSGGWRGSGPTVAILDAVALGDAGLAQVGLVAWLEGQGRCLDSFPFRVLSLRHHFSGV